MAGKKNSRKRMFDLEALEVSLVPTGANNRKFLLTKENEEAIVDEIIEQILKEDLKNEDQIDEILKAQDKLSPEQKKAVKGAMRLLSSVKGNLPDDVMKQIQGLAGGKAETKKEDDGAEPETKKTETNKEDKPSGDGDNKEAAVNKDEITKALEQNQEVIKGLKTENEKLREEIKKERDARVMKEFEAKAEEFTHLGKSKEEIAKMLKDASESMSEESYKMYVETLKSASETVKKSSIFKELGSSQGGEGTVSAQIEAKKAEIRKEKPDLSEAQLEDEMFQRNPELYNDYLDENPNQGGR